MNIMAEEYWARYENIEYNITTGDFSQLPSLTVYRRPKKKVYFQPKWTSEEGQQGDRDQSTYEMKKSEDK